MVRLKHACEWRSEALVPCIAGPDGLGEGPVLFGHLPKTYGIQARAALPEVLMPDNLLRLQTSDLAMVCLSFMSEPCTAPIRYAVPPIRRRVAQARAMVRIWCDRDPAKFENLRRQTSADHLVTSLVKAVAAILGAVTGAGGPNGMSGLDPPEARRVADHVS
jgi:hypothetical protein